MIKVCFTKKEDKYIVLSITGHANMGDFGEDLVCAEASAISFGLCNALFEMAHIESIDIIENYIHIYIPEPNDLTQNILRVAYYQFKTIEHTHPKAIKITEE
ncbi:MAG: ribosomal-processing cysteine protease Prp [Solobacterium sp.]|nr:ribosomal-processing cysteine protease Prp [Solobacterium sp.]